MGEKELKLLNFLLREGHLSVLRHCSLQFEIYAPLMVVRQWYRYIVGSDHTMDAFNESSRRYITEEPVFHLPSINEWRSAPENKKQGSGASLTPDKGQYLTSLLETYQKQGEILYNDAMLLGVAPEQARLFLPAYGLMLRWRWTGSLQSVLFFLSQRLEHDSQKEIQVFAQAVRDIVAKEFPETFKAWVATN